MKREAGVGIRWVMPVLLAGCLSLSAAPVDPGGGIGGTGREAGGGIGGTGILGPIESIEWIAGGGIGGTGATPHAARKKSSDSEPVLLASLEIAGLRVMISDRAQPAFDAQFTQAYLTEGMVLAVRAESREGQLWATEVIPVVPAEGRAESAGPDSWLIGGQLVRVTPMTAGSAAIQEGAEVRASGLPQPDQSIEATRILTAEPPTAVARKLPDPRFGGQVSTVVVEGYVAEGSDPAAIRLAGLEAAPFDASGLNAPDREALAGRVRLRAMRLESGVWRIEQVERVTRRPEAERSTPRKNDDERRSLSGNDLRDDRAERAERAERSERVERTERSERTERIERVERAERAERAERSERVERTERTERSERSERSERPERSERTERGERSGRD